MRMSAQPSAAVKTASGKWGKFQKLTGKERELMVMPVWISGVFSFGCHWILLHCILGGRWWDGRSCREGWGKMSRIPGGASSTGKLQVGKRITGKQYVRSRESGDWLWEGYRLYGKRQFQNKPKERNFLRANVLCARSLWDFQKYLGKLFSQDISSSF